MLEAQEGDNGRARGEVSHGRIRLTDLSYGEHATQDLYTYVCVCEREREKESQAYIYIIMLCQH